MKRPAIIAIGATGPIPPLRQRHTRTGIEDGRKSLLPQLLRALTWIAKGRR